jgi:TetR/AcrR family transcriptional regulator, mexJK operon transcriptional repressor
MECELRIAKTEGVSQVDRRAAKAPGADALACLQQTRRAGRPARDAALLLSDRILDAAHDLFLTQGFAATSLQQIASVAGATKRTLYVKVGDKAELFGAVVHRLLDHERGTPRSDEAEASTRARLVKFGNDVLHAALSTDVLRLNRLLVAEAPRFPALADLMEKQMMGGTTKRLTELLRDEIKRKRLTLDDPQLSAQLLVATLIGMPQRAVLYGQVPWTQKRINEWVVGAVDMFLRGA